MTARRKRATKATPNVPEEDNVETSVTAGPSQNPTGNAATMQSTQRPISASRQTVTLERDFTLPSVESRDLPVLEQGHSRRSPSDIVVERRGDGVHSDSSGRSKSSNKSVDRETMRQLLERMKEMEQQLKTQELTIAHQTTLLSGETSRAHQGPGQASMHSTTFPAEQQHSGSIPPPISHVGYQSHPPPTRDTNRQHPFGGTAPSSALGPIPSIQNSNPGSTSSIKVKYRDPPVYYGDRDPRFLLLQIQSDIMPDLEHFAADKTKIDYAARNLGDNSAIKKKFQLMLLSGKNEPATRNWEAFKAWCMSNYGATDPVLSAKLGIQNLRYQPGQSIRQFINEFETHLMDLHWDDSAVIVVFREKLPLHITRRINQGHFQHRPSTFAEYKLAAITAENNIELERQGRGDEHTHYPQSKNPKRVRFTPISSPPRSNSVLADRTPNGPAQSHSISQEERDRRKRLGLCNYWGGSGHYATACPAKRRGNRSTTAQGTNRVPISQSKNKSPRV
ncbi:MAG: hypothetical protein M1823_006052 [Watsoniomyces obsoletus]|nr:MAG: hypothetical protein M1823_006052 [Watsoniomyces obsoletus]